MTKRTSGINDIEPQVTDTLADVSDRIEVEGGFVLPESDPALTALGGGPVRPPKKKKERCPICGKGPFKSLKAHERLMHGLQVEKVAEEEEREYFDREDAEFLVDSGVMIVKLATRSEHVLSPEGWRERAVAVHQKWLNKRLGKYVGEYSVDIWMVLTWSQLFYVNYLAEAERKRASANYSGDRPEGNGEDALPS